MSPSTNVPDVGLPKMPYRGLEHYGAEDRLLFSGRAQDVETCGHFLADPQTRVLLLHGQTGCGKSSFLRAGLIPSLEKHGFGYLFLRAYSSEADEWGSPAFIRCGPDPIGRLAERLWHFAARPLLVQTVKGVQSYDLCSVYDVHKDAANLSAFVAACRRPGGLTRVLLHLSQIIPLTLILIVDQAEEVITLAQANNECRNQFFRFVKDFTTVNFPLKIVLALRKDYSGEFIGLAQLGSSISLSHYADAARSDDDLQRDPLVKSDIKLFLLRELDRTQVLEAIRLPTSEKPLEREPLPPVTPFDQYEFTYAGGVAEEIVEDLFKATSAGASLPVMQIVCRDLYMKVQPRLKPRIIDSTLYRDGGRITGPVDRHISTSISKSIDAAVFAVPAELIAEERRIRLLLYRLVRRESDGSIHTNVVSLAQLQAVASEIGVRSNVERVVNRLTQPDALLLRTFSLLPTDEPDERQLFSLGHDVIGVVLQDWKTRKDAEALARERLARTIRIAVRSTAFVILLAVLVTAGLIVAMKQGEDSIVLDVLENTTANKQRAQPYVAMDAAAQALKVTERIHSRLFWLPENDSPRKRLAHLLAGLPTPVMPEPADAEPRSTNSSYDIYPLPRLGGFMTIHGREVIITRNGAGKPQPHPYPIGTEETLSPFAQLGDTTVAETAGGDVLLLLRERLYVLPHDSANARRFEKSYFEGKAQAYSPQRQQHATAVEASASGNALLTSWLAVFDNMVILFEKTVARTPQSDHQLRIVINTWDATRPDMDPFRVARVLYRDAAPTSQQPGLPVGNVLFLGDYIVLVQPQSSAGAGQPGNPGARAWSLQTYLASGSESTQENNWNLNEKLGRIKCSDRATRAPCLWQWVPGQSNTLMAFGVLDPQKLEKTRQYEYRPGDLSTFRRLAFLNVADGRILDVDFGSVAGKCLDPTADEQPAANLHGRGHGKAWAGYFGTIDHLLLATFLESSVDIVEISQEAGRTQSRCLGTLYFADDVQRWALAQNSQTLLAAGSRARLGWDVTTPVEERAHRMLNGDLTALACQAGLSLHELQGQEWIDATGLKTPPDKICTNVKP